MRAPNAPAGSSRAFRYHREVTPRPSLAAALALLLLVEMPTTAAAQARPAVTEATPPTPASAQAQPSATITTPATPTTTPPTATIWRDLTPPLRPIGGPLSLVRAESLPRLSLFVPQPTEIRLSSGAKTAIIVGAIVVGVLLLAGIVVLSKPGKKL